MDLITNEIVPPLFWLKCNTAATKLHTASSAIKLRKIRRNSTTLATLTSSCSSDNNSSNIFSIKTTATTSFQWLFLILLIYLFNGYNSGLADAQDIDECRVHPNICGTGICKNDEGSYKCYCPPGYTGIHCDWDVDECLSQPCQNGATCHNKINAYECVCAQGYMGLNCEVVCNVNYGGKDCSVPLKGCMGSPCLNGGFCKPYLVNVTEHLFNCTCQDGFQGDTCEKTTTISMVKGSLITVKTQRDEGYDMNLQFRTTLPNGVLAFGTSGELNEPVSYILELINGRLNLHSSLLNKWEGVFIGSKLNDSNWHKVFVAINTSHLVLSANDEQVIYPVHSYETETAGKPSFALTYLGGTIPYLKSFLRHLTHPPSDFVGCMQNILVNGKWIFPKEISSDQDTDLKDVQSGCQRKEQCAPSPCHSNGECTDLWHTFSCSCKPPHFGHTCKYTYNYVL